MCYTTERDACWSTSGMIHIYQYKYSHLPICLEPLHQLPVYCKLFLIFCLVYNWKEGVRMKYC